MCALADTSLAAMLCASMEEKEHAFEKLQTRLRRAMRSNFVDSAAHLLSLTVAGTGDAVDPVSASRPLRESDGLARGAEQLLRETFARDGAECALTLLNCLEERRRRLHEQERKRLDEQEMQTHGKKQKTTREERQKEKERHCAPAPNSAGLLELAKEALTHQPAPAKRVARACLLHAHRLRGMVVDPSQCEADLGVPWPRAVADMPPELAGGEGTCGGFDLSDGAEPVPVQWVNTVRLPPEGSPP